MIRHFIKDAGIYLIPGLLSRSIAFLLLPIYTRVLSTEQYGTLDLLIVMGSLVNLTVALEINQGLAFYHAEARDGAARRAYASTAFWFTLACYTLFALLAYAWADPLAAWVIGTEGAGDYLRLAVIYMFTNGLFLFLQNQLRWELRSRAYAASHIVMSLVTALGVLLSTLVLEAGLRGILLSMIAGAGVASLLSLAQLMRSLAPAFDRARLREMLSYSLPLVPSGLCVFLSLYIDRVMINQMLSLADVGVYGVAARIALMVGAVVSGAGAALTPLILRHHRDPQTPGQLAALFHFFTAGGLLLALGFFLFSPEFLRLMTTPGFYAAAAVLPWLVAATLMANLYIFTPGVFLAKQTHRVLWINLASALTNIALNFWLIPAWGVMGAAFATLCSGTLAFGLYAYYNQKTYPIRFRARALALAAAATALLAWAGRFTPEPLAQAILCKLLLMGAGTYALYRLRLLPHPAILLARKRSGF